MQFGQLISECKIKMQRFSLGFVLSFGFVIIFAVAVSISTEDLYILVNLVLASHNDKMQNVTHSSSLLTSCLDPGILPIMVMVLVLSFPLFPLWLTWNKKVYIYIYTHAHTYMGCVCARARVREWVSLLLPPADGFGLNNVIIKAFPEELPASPPPSDTLTNNKSTAWSL